MTCRDTGVGAKPGLWTLDWTMDWTLDCILDWILDWILALKACQRSLYLSQWMPMGT